MNYCHYLQQNYYLWRKDYSVKVKSFVDVATASIVLPGKIIERDSAVGAEDVANIKNRSTGKNHDSWLYHSDREYL